MGAMGAVGARGAMGAVGAVGAGRCDGCDGCDGCDAQNLRTGELGSVENNSSRRSAGHFHRDISRGAILALPKVIGPTLFRTDMLATRSQLEERGQQHSEKTGVRPESQSAGEFERCGVVGPTKYRRGIWSTRPQRVRAVPEYFLVVVEGGRGRADRMRR